MATGTTRIVTDNFAVKPLLSSTSPRIAVGSTAPRESATYPVSNVFVNDRAVKWYAPGLTPGAPMDVVIDIGSAKTIDTIGILGFERAPGALFPTSILTFGYKTFPDPSVASCVGTGTPTITRASFNFAGAGVKVGQYALVGTIMPVQRQVTAVAVGSVTLDGNSGSGTGTVTFTDRMDFPTIALSSSGVLDRITPLLAPVSARYVNFQFQFTTGDFTVGKFIIGDMTDLGIAYSPGSTETLVKNGVSNKSVGGARLFTQTGPDTRRLSMIFSRVTQATKDLLVARAAERVIAMIHPTLGAIEVALVDDELEASHLWSSPDLWDVTLDVEQLP